MLGQRLQGGLALDALNGYKDFGEDFGGLDASIRLHATPGGDYLILLVRQGFFTKELWSYYRSERPVYSVTAAGAPLLQIYEIRPVAKTGENKPPAINPGNPP
jgi:hypothetical protein